MTTAKIGWVWVGGQALLLGALILLPQGDNWSVPGWLDRAASVVFFAGLVLVAVAALGLGTALTPTPVPRQTGALQTGGLYRAVRHPIYSGVLLVVIGMVAGSGSIVRLVIGALTLVFFDRKAAWEEGRLVEHYPEYREYAARTAKFVPWVW